MVQTAIFTLTSELHDEQAVDAVTKDFLGSLGIDHLFKGSDYSDYGSHTLNLIFVRTAFSKRCSPNYGRNQAVPSTC